MREIILTWLAIIATFILAAAGILFIYVAWVSFLFGIWVFFWMFVVSFVCCIGAALIIWHEVNR